MASSISDRISRVVAGGLFALFVGLLIQAFTVFGVIAVNSGHLFMFFAWGVGSLLIVTEILPLRPTRHKLWSVVGLGITLLVIDVACAGYAAKRESEKIAEHAPTPSPSAQIPLGSPSASPPASRRLSPDARAIELKREGERLMNEGKYKEAKAKFSRALKIIGVSADLESQLRKLLIRAETMDTTKG